MPSWLFGFQQYLVNWALRQGRAAILADCGLGKGPIQLVCAMNVIQHTNRPVLIVAPLAVTRQFVHEGEKFGIEVNRTSDGKLKRGVVNVTNYERLDRYDPAKIACLCCDESGVLKHFDTKTRKQVTSFMQEIPNRFLGTATPAPNDFVELGSSAEALGVMKNSQMLGRFFSHCGDESSRWELKGHAKQAYWRWVAKWARAMRKPSDFGFDDDGFILPDLHINHHVVPAACEYPGFFPVAIGLDEQRKEKRKSLSSRCEKVAELVPSDRPAVVWCHLNDESDYLEKIIPDAVQVRGNQSDEIKEERLTGFSDGEIRVLITKAKIGGWGLNWQHCSDVFCFSSHSYEAFYQTVRRCWRFGQAREVNVNLVYTEAEGSVVENMLQKERRSSELFDGIIREMHGYQIEKTEDGSIDEMEIPQWV
jgi:hypothetical protein